MKKKILVVDDDELLREFLYELLSRKYDVTTSRDGTFGLEEISNSVKNNTPYNVMITDICMPRMDGVKLLKNIYEKNLKGDMRIIVATGGTSRMISNYQLPEDSIERRIFEYGAERIIQKPFNSREIIDYIENSELEYKI